MATPNYSYEKRQRELAKKRKTEEKRLRKLNKAENPGEAEAGEGEAPEAENLGGDSAPGPNETT